MCVVRLSGQLGVACVVLEEAAEEGVGGPGIVFVLGVRCFGVLGVGLPVSMASGVSVRGVFLPSGLASGPRVLRALDERAGGEMRRPLAMFRSRGIGCDCLPSPGV